MSNILLSMALSLLRPNMLLTMPGPLIRGISAMISGWFGAGLKNGRYLQVIFVYREDEDVEMDSLSPADLLAFSEGRAEVVTIIHAMNLTDEQKRTVRKRI